MTTMDVVYFLVGFVVVWGASMFGVLVVVGQLCRLIEYTYKRAWVYPMTVAEARDRYVCRICHKKADGALTLNFGAEFAHTKCLERETDSTGANDTQP